MARSPSNPSSQWVLVEDNGPIHTSKLSLAALATRAHWLIVEWLPKYAPELNDIERVWHDLKAHHLQRIRPSLTQANSSTRSTRRSARSTPSATRTRLPLAGLRISPGHSVPGRHRGVAFGTSPPTAAISAPRSAPSRPLHTWGQTLQHHPHLHCIVPGGGLSPDGARWVACRPGFFLPVRVLSQRFRDLFVARLAAAYAAGALRFSGTLASLAEPDAFAGRLEALRGIDWVVYAKPPFAGPAPVLAYLGRYTHRVAIANSRLTRLADGHVDFSWKDYRHDGKTKTMTLSADEFIRRFLLHTVPDGFHRIRHLGFLANGHRTAKLALCRALLAVPPPDPSPRQSLRERYQQLTGVALDVCPDCGGCMLERGPLPRRPPPHARFWCDTS